MVKKGKLHVSGFLRRSNVRPHDVVSWGRMMWYRGAARCGIYWAFSMPSQFAPDIPVTTFLLRDRT